MRPAERCRPRRAVHCSAATFSCDGEGRALVVVGRAEKSPANADAGARILLSAAMQSCGHGGGYGFRISLEMHPTEFANPTGSEDDLFAVRRERARIRARE